MKMKIMILINDSLPYFPSWISTNKFVTVRYSKSPFKVIPWKGIITLWSAFTEMQTNIFFVADSTQHANQQTFTVFKIQVIKPLVISAIEVIVVIKSYHSFNWTVDKRSSKK